MAATSPVPVRAYRAHPAITKAVFVAEMQAHAAADRLVQGRYVEYRQAETADYGSFARGCAVGCGVATLNRRLGGHAGYADHAALADALGIPIELAHLQDCLFEGLPAADARAWPAAFAAAIPEGADLSDVWPHLAVWLLTDDARGVLRFASTDAARSAITRVASLYRRRLAADEPTITEWRAAAAASDAYAAYAAYDAAYAAYAAYAAGAAGAADARRGAWYRACADHLLALLAAAPVPAGVGAC